MAWSTPPTFTTGEFPAAAKLQIISADLSDLDRRTTPAEALILGTSSTTSAPWVDLPDAVGPAVTVTIGSTGKALVGIAADYGTTAVDTTAHVSVVGSGATTIAAAFSRQLLHESAAGGTGTSNGRVDLFTGMNAGSTTYTMKYGVGGAATANFNSRRLLVTPLGA